MTEFKSDSITLDATPEMVFNKLSDLENLRTFIDKIPADKIPADKLEQFRNLKITPDSISFPSAPMGEMTLAVKERTPHSLIRLEGVGMPVTLALELRLLPEGTDKCNAVVAICADIPMMLKPMVKGPLQKAVDQFAQVLKVISFAD